MTEVPGQSRKPSIFAQRLQNARKRKHENCSNPTTSTALFGDSSNVVTGPDGDAIHKENTYKLAAMTVEEIEMERNKLLSEMDPKLVEFLRSKKHKTIRTSSDSKTGLKINKTEMNLTEEMPLQSGSLTTAHELLKTWPNLGTIEDDKIKWMEDVPSVVNPKTDAPYDARFSFDGTLLPYVDEKLDVRQGLHHHGEEPERPGYTLQELIQLSRSAVLQQRIVALNTLANIIEKANFYVDCLDKPLLPILLDAELFLMLRFSLDDGTRSIVTASLAALCNLLVNHADEICLDNLLGLTRGIYQPTLHTVVDLKENEINELKDPELLRLDVIRGALRTHILQRFRYILCKMNPESTEVVQILKCLIRIVRHSNTSTLSIINSPGLLDSVWSLMTSENTNFYPDALKLLRLIASRHENFACVLLEKYPIIDTIQRILAGSLERQPEAMRLMLESFYLWQTMLHYNLTIDQISNFTPVLARLLSVHIEHTRFESSVGDQEHVVALLTTLATTFKSNYSDRSMLMQLAIRVTEKCISQLIASSVITRPMYKLTGASLACFAAGISVQNVTHPEIVTKLTNYFLSDSFTISISLLRKYSWLLSNDTDRYKRNSADNLPCIAAVSPTFQPECPQPLFEGLVAFLLAAQDNKLCQLFLKNPAWESYFHAIINKDKLIQNANHWFARQEIKLLCDILLLNIHCQTIDQDLVHRIALIMAMIIHTDDKQLLKDILQKIIFDEKYFMKHIISLTAQVEELGLSNDQKKDTTVLQAINSLTNIKRCYLIELGLDQEDDSALQPVTLTASERGYEPALPSDWQFLPVLRLYNCEGKGENALDIATCSLQWILLIEHFHPDIARMTPITARFSRTCCLFMAGNDLFMDVTDLLKALLRLFISSDEIMDIEASVPGLNSFYDFYRQLVDHFVEVSYGNAVFGQYILVPLQQCFNVKFRKLIWSEQAPLVRVLSTPIDELVIPMQAFLEPIETDPQLLATYLQYIATGKVRPQWSPILYRIAVHHVSTFIVKYSDNKFSKILRQKIEALGNSEFRTMLLEYSS